METSCDERIVTLEKAAKDLIKRGRLMLKVTKDFDERLYVHSFSNDGPHISNTYNKQF